MSKSIFMYLKSFSTPPKIKQTLNRRNKNNSILNGIYCYYIFFTSFLVNSLATYEPTNHKG